MKWLLSALIVVGALSVFGLLRPWTEIGSADTPVTRILGITVGAVLWVLFPMMVGWIFLSRNRHSLTRTLLLIYTFGLLLIWTLGAIVSIGIESFDGNLGLLFWPVIEWIGLFAIFVIWSFEGAHRQNQDVQQGAAASPADR